MIVKLPEWRLLCYLAYAACLLGCFSAYNYLSPLFCFSCKWTSYTNTDHNPNVKGLFIEKGCAIHHDSSFIQLQL